MLHVILSVQVPTVTVLWGYREESSKKDGEGIIKIINVILINLLLRLVNISFEAEEKKGGTPIQTTAYCSASTDNSLYRCLL